ncbi:hypothetical protein E3N88_11730 [Mikania micrantha]|uniref:Uncharacterized protein n=1 Tax=Mikania micrantha TaxID=192012 RepID=A0A5N6P5B1_9ASTR|nr:hypothetical protein E3N88_11730 [Mikania micrantha]
MIHQPGGERSCAAVTGGAVRWRPEELRRWWERRDATRGAAGGWRRGRWLVAATWIWRRPEDGGDQNSEDGAGAFAQDAEDEI